jgi:hypothetical protein
VNDIEQRLVDLADVVKERNAFDGALVVFIELRSIGDDERTRGDPAHVHACDRVVGFDGVEERLEAGTGETLERPVRFALTSEKCGAGDRANDQGQSWVHGRIETQEVD